MSVLQILPSLEAGGAERATVDIAAALAKEGHQALVISSGGRMVRELEQKGGQHFTWPVNTKNPAAIFKNARRLEEFIGQEKVDFVHARSRAPAWSALMAVRRARVPFVTTFHAAYKGSSMPWKKIYNSVMARGDRVIAISRFIAEYIRRNYGVKEHRIALIPRGIDFETYNPATITPERKTVFLGIIAAPSDMPIILVPGRLSPIKGQELVLRALAQVKHPCMTVIVGPDQGRHEYNRYLHSLAEDLRLQKVRFLPMADLPAAYACARLVLSPSQVPEGFGRVPVEAQALGVPVIATALGATNETIKPNQTGWLVPKGDAAALASAIEVALSLSEEERLRMGETAKSFVRSQFDVKQMCAATLKVYEDVLREARR